MPLIYRSMFAINNINNGALSAMNAMPQKDITSDGETSFALDRKNYKETLPTVTTTVSQKIHKKWFGNRDASQVTTNRRVTEIGVGSMNANKNLSSFTTYKEVNTVSDALTRVRSGGSVAPAKKGANRKNAPTPSFPTGVLIRNTCCNDDKRLATIQPKTALVQKKLTTVIYH